MHYRHNRNYGKRKIDGCAIDMEYYIRYPLNRKLIVGILFLTLLNTASFALTNNRDLKWIFIALSIFFLLIAASMYSRMLTLSRLPAELTDWIVHLQVHPGIVLLAVIVLLLILGMILDSVSILLLTVPIIAPVASALGYDLIWLGIVVIITIELGLLTPPFGMVVFAMKAALPDSVTLEDIYAGSAPFLLVLLLTLAVIVMFPQLTLFVPNLLFG